MIEISISNNDEKKLLTALESTSKLINYDMYVEIKNILLNAFSKKIITDVEINRIIALLEDKKYKKNSESVDKYYNHNKTTKSANSNAKTINNQNIIYQANLTHFMNTLTKLCCLNSHGNKNNHKNSM